MQLAGGKRTVRVVAIDYSNNLLVLDQALAWSDGQGVALAYDGEAPDMGAFEYISK